MAEVVTGTNSIKTISHTIKVIIVVDLPLMSEAIEGWIEKQQDMEIIAEARNAREAIEVIARLRPDIVIMDMSLQENSSPEALGQILEACPGTRVLISTISSDNGQPNLLMQAGASGCFAKNASGREIIHAIRTIAAEENVTVTNRLPYVADSLTNKIDTIVPNQDISSEINYKELNILKLVAKGMSNKDIALHLGISLRCVKSHLSTLFLKLSVSSRTQAISAGLKAGLLSLNDFTR